MIELPDHTIEHIRFVLERELKEYARCRQNDVDRGAETQDLSAVLLEKYGEGLTKSLRLIFEAMDLREPELKVSLDELVQSIDPEWKSNKKKRWEARPASINYDTKIGE